MLQYRHVLYNIVHVVFHAETIGRRAYKLLWPVAVGARGRCGRYSRLLAAARHWQTVSTVCMHAHRALLDVCVQWHWPLWDYWYGGTYGVKYWCHLFDTFVNGHIISCSCSWQYICLWSSLWSSVYHVHYILIYFFAYYLLFIMFIIYCLLCLLFTVYYV